MYHGGVAKTLNAVKSDADHVPCVIIGRKAWCIGNGQVHDAISPSREVSKTLNCLDDPMKILIVRDETDRNDSRPSDTEDVQ